MTLDEGQIRRLVLTELARGGDRYVPVGVSVKHVHLSRQDLETLFGAGYELHPLRALAQPGQYAAAEQVTLAGPKGSLEKVRIIGPVRKDTQVEISMTDAMSIGLKKVPIRLSGDIKGTPGITIIGPKGELKTTQGTILAARHMHMSAAQAAAFGIHNGQVVRIRVEGERPCIFDNVVCRTGEGHELEFHVDTDEANSCMIKSGDLLQVLFVGESENTCGNHSEGEKTCGCGHGEGEKTCSCGSHSEGEKTCGCGSSSEGEKTCSCGSHSEGEKTCGCSDHKEMTKTEETTPNTEHTAAVPERVLDLVTERDINEAVQRHIDILYCEEKALITPSAADRALEYNIQIRRTVRKEEIKVEVPSEETPILDLVTERDLNDAYRDDKEVIYCTLRAPITAAAADRSAETGIKIIRVGEDAACR